MRMSITWIYMLISALIVTQSNVYAAEQALPGATVFAIQVPNDFNLIPNATKERFSSFGFDLVRWPEPDEIKSHLVDVSSNKVVQKIVISTFDWAARILKKEWVPSTLYK